MLGCYKSEEKQKEIAKHVEKAMWSHVTPKFYHAHFPSFHVLSIQT